MFLLEELLILSKKMIFVSDGVKWQQKNGDESGLYSQWIIKDSNLLFITNEFILNLLFYYRVVLILLMQPKIIHIFNLF